MKKGFKELKPEVGNREQVIEAATKLALQGHQHGAISKIASSHYEVGIKIGTLPKPQEKKAPKTVEKQLQKIVEKEIASEAVRKINEALKTGKSLEDTFGPLAAEYGYDSTADFLMMAFDFYMTWKDQVKELVEECELLKEAMREVLLKITPTARAILADRAILDFVISVVALGNQTGKYPPKGVLEEMIGALQEKLA